MVEDMIKVLSERGGTPIEESKNQFCLSLWDTLLVMGIATHSICYPGYLQSS